MNLGIDGKIALVTASSAGIGFACASALAAEGATVCLSSSNENNIEAAVAKLSKSSGSQNIHGFICDMRESESVQQLCEKVTSEVGTPDILVNNTGGPKPATFFELSLEDWDVGYRLIMESTVILYNKLIPAMKEKGWGRIVNITSTTSRQPIAGLTLSNAFRPGLLGLIKTVADEVGKDGVLINTVMPGLTMTDRMKQLAEVRGENSMVERLKNEIPLGRAADPMEQGHVVAFLCSDKASFVTSTALAVDGGGLRGI